MKKQICAIWIQIQDTGIIVHIKTDDIYKDIVEDTSNYELDRPSPKGKNKK